ncbi:hypothetical protein BC629DRAFT_1036179 [Irpex lacteus]|nr:hypothetical protein BC629DRAFT_1036179 [Irpex lacteus]
MFTWVAELAFDTCVFLAMVYGTLDTYRRIPITTRRDSITEVLLRDGVVYFGVTFGANFVTVMIYLFATPVLKVINASFGTLITTLMVSRLILNLRLSAFRPDTEVLDPPCLPQHAHRREDHLAQRSPQADIPMPTFRVTHSTEDGSITHDDVKELEHT